ncbi:hypothetical protein N483_23580 [Pseudoalteromonas luteoviolacea NCIMB 1944]|nr:hypothetical protein N483_23580 [Pseudoalteromonas luteoviolacea NCIMB 1944]
MADVSIFKDLFQHCLVDVQKVSRRMTESETKLTFFVQRSV